MTDETTRLLERLAETFPDQPAPLPAIVAAAHAGRRRRAHRTVALVAGACVLAVGAGTALAQVVPDDDRAHSVDRIADPVPEQACDKDNPVPPRDPVPAGPNYLTNAAGETYGSVTDGSPQPDLLAAVGDCGRTGYIRRGDLDEPPPWVPGAGSGEPLSTPVYESDGVTRIDTFTQDEGVSGPVGPDGSPLPSFAPPTGPDAADLEGEWRATIAGASSGGREHDDTYRDLDLRLVFRDSSVEAYDGCSNRAAGFTLEDGAFAMTTPFELELADEPGCERAAPLAAILDNVRHVTQAGTQTYLHLENFRIAIVLTRAR